MKRDYLRDACPPVCLGPLPSNSSGHSEITSSTTARIGRGHHRCGIRFDKGSNQAPVEAKGGLAGVQRTD
jgi:hypothetical protein